MGSYIINRENLSVFIKKIYEEGAFGYLDLKESVCEKMLNDFLATQDIYSSNIIPSNTYPNSPDDSICINVSTISGQYYEITDSYGNVDIPVFVNIPASPNNYFARETEENYQESITSHSFNVQPQAAEETQTKIRVVNYNFNGNESERL